MRQPPFTEYATHISTIANAAISAVMPDRAVRRFLKREDGRLIVGENRYQPDNGRVFLVSIGKAALPMAQAAAEILQEDLNAGIIVGKRFSGAAPEAAPHPALQSITAAHPVADESSLAAATAVLQLLARTTADDLVIFLISGGASALISQPLIPLPAWQECNRALLASGCTIQEFNTVRRQFDQVKGGGLAAAAAPAACVSLILSDVIGNDLAAIGSGPTFFSAERPQAAGEILQRYRLDSVLPAGVWQKLTDVSVSTRKNERLPAKNNHLIIGDVRTAARAAAKQAAALGFETQILTTHLEGEAREAGKFAAACARDLPPGHCLILGGETTVTLRGSGIGGRNTELALAAALSLHPAPQRVVATLATDGDDGPTGAAGGIATGGTVVAGEKLGLAAAQFLHNNDSYTFLNQLHPHHPALLQTGPTGTNVNDLIFILHYS